ncbi:hypothetical protein LCGC14_2778850 [marine sediment metagenome]|uniref:Uncharacterized protein n=1 Tax=marine sediment metagenome TaxID=412755 RepID=A0A0F9B2R1_9ZZZZ
MVYDAIVAPKKQGTHRTLFGPNGALASIIGVLKE